MNAKRFVHYGALLEAIVKLSVFKVDSTQICLSDLRGVQKRHGIRAVRGEALKAKMYCGTGFDFQSGFGFYLLTNKRCNNNINNNTLLTKLKKYINILRHGLKSVRQK